MNNVTETFWDPCNLLLKPDMKEKYAVIVLNCPINVQIKKTQLLSLWNSAAVRVTVDGGTDRWLNWIKCNFYNEQKQILPPDLITGDMDSIRQETLMKYKDNPKTEVIYTENQNETDFTKSLAELKTYCCKNNITIKHVAVLNNTTGRFDQIISNVNTLCKMKQRWADLKIYLVSDNISWLLTRGEHWITVPLHLRVNKDWCALIPVNGRVLVTTSGLKWNLNNSFIEFGGMVSTSNTYDDTPGDVYINCDEDLIWSMGINNLVAGES